MKEKNLNLNLRLFLSSKLIISFLAISQAALGSRRINQQLSHSQQPE
jgi:hypothetical protein